MRKTYMLALSALVAAVAFVMAPSSTPSVQASVITGVDTYALTLAASPAEQVSYELD